MWHAIEAVAPSLSVLANAAAPRDAAEIERTIEPLGNEPGSGVVVLPNPITNLHRELLIALMARHHLPAVYSYPYLVTNGGLISYDVDPGVQFRQAAAYFDRVLKGAKPADLPIQQPTKFELAINHTVAALADPAAYAILARPAAARLSARAYSVPSLSGGGAVATRSGPATRFCCSTNSLKSASRVAGSSGGAAAAAGIAGTLSSAR
jgi:hypothetical protein